MKNIILTGIIATAILGFAGAYALHQTMPAESVVALPGPYAEAVHKYITVEDPYKEWRLWPGKGKKYRARPPLTYATTYVNNNARVSIKSGEKMVDGSLIVTENYNDAKKLATVFVMYKLRGYNPAAGDWFWAQYDPQGKTQVEGKVKTCIECHTKVKSNDYVFTSEFVKSE